MNRASWVNLKSWLMEVDRYARGCSSIVIVANKIDCNSSNQQVTIAETKEFLDEWRENSIDSEFSVNLIEVSALHKFNTEVALRLLVEEICFKVVKNKYAHQIQKNLMPLKESKKKNSCKVM